MYINTSITLIKTCTNSKTNKADKLANICTLATSTIMMFPFGQNG